MATTPLVSVEEYLHTAYRPDCDYVDGIVQERNLGQHDHARLQALLLFFLMQRETEWGIYVLPEQRLRIQPGRYRVPDLMVLSKDAPRTPVIEQAPLLCIEIVSPEDRLPCPIDRCWDYNRLGVPETWVFDPETKRTFVATDFKLAEVASDVVLSRGVIQLRPDDFFGQL